MNDQDKKEMKQMMIETFNEGLEQVVMPVLNEVLETVKEIKDDVSDLKDDVSDLKAGQAKILKIQERETERLDTYEAELKILKKRVAA